MKKKLLLICGIFALAPFYKSQNITVFNDVPFYSMYHYLGEGQTLPNEALTAACDNYDRLAGVNQ